MSKKKKDNEVLNKVVELCLIYEIKDSELYLKILDNQIKFYQYQIELLKENKPLFFQKEKLKEHNQKLNECYEKIADCYIRIGNEVDLIKQMRDSIAFNSE